MLLLVHTFRSVLHLFYDGGVTDRTAVFRFLIPGVSFVYWDDNPLPNDERIFSSSTSTPFELR